MTIAAAAIIMPQMRISPSSIAMVVAAALAAPASLSGCKKEEKSAPQPAGEPSAAAASAAPKRPKRETAPMFRKRAEAARRQFGLVQLGADEVMPLVPKLTGAVQNGKPMITTGGRQVNVIHCLAQNDPAKIKAEFEQKLGELGYSAIRFRDKPKKKDRGPKELVRITAEKGMYRLTVAVQSAPFFDCKESEKKVKLVMFFFKRTDQPPAGPQTPESPAGPQTPAAPAGSHTPASPVKAQVPASPQK